MNIDALKLAYKTLGLTDVTTQDITGFSDNSTIKSNFSGYLSAWKEDAMGDTILNTAYDTTIREAYARRADSGGAFLWPILYQHNADNPIGGILEARTDEKGLRVECFLDTDIRLGAAVLSGLKKQYLKAMSIGFKVVKSIRGIGNKRILQEIELFEGSIVTFGANEQAEIIPGSVKYKGTFYGIDDIIDNMKDDTTMTELKAYKKYYSSDIAETLQVDKNLINYLIDRGMKEWNIQAKRLQNDYVLDGSEIARLAKLYSRELKTDRMENDRPMHISVKLAYPEYNTHNALVLETLEDATSDDLKMNKELDDREYSRK